MKTITVILLLVYFSCYGQKNDPVIIKPTPDKGYPFFMMSTERRDKLKNPGDGMFIYNTDTRCLNMFNGERWAEVCGTCTPKPPQANAGADQTKGNDSIFTLAANNPGAGNTGLWTNLSSGPWTFSNPVSYNSTFIGNLGEKYTLRWTLTNGCGSTNDDAKITANFGAPCPGLDSFLYSGKYYHTILIDSQCWMKENLDVGIKIGIDISPHNNGYIEKHCYNDEVVNCALYGGLYTFDEMIDYQYPEGVHGICPAGWHVPSQSDWVTLTGYLSGDAGKLKERGNVHWYTPNTGASNTTGFTALPGGFMNYYRESFNAGERASLWVSKYNSPLSAYYIELYYNTSATYMSATHSTYERYVRCIKN